MGSAGSGWEWRWQEDVEASAKDIFKVGGAWMVASQTSSAESHRVEEWVRLFDGSAVSIRCSTCTLAHGPPKLPHGSVRNNAVGEPRLPEDIAIAFAKCVVQLRAAINAQAAVLHPVDVVAVASRVAEIAVAIEGFPETAFVADILKAAGGCSLTGELDGVAGCALVDFVKQTRELLNEIEERADKVREACRVCGWCPAKDASIQSGLPSISQPRAHSMCIDRVRYESHLDKDFTQKALKQRGFESPVFALVDHICGMPRQTRGATTYCVCNVPWNRRPSWERLPWAVYVLPPVHEGWSVISSDADGTAWVCQGTGFVKQPLAFTRDLQTIHNAASCIVTPGAGSCPRPPSSSCGDLAAWVSEDEAETKAEGDDLELEAERGRAEVDGDEESQEAAEESERETVESSPSDSHASQDSDTLDFEDPEGYFECPQTPPRKRPFQDRVVWGRSAQKEARPPNARADDDQVAGPVSDSPVQKRSWEPALQCSDIAAREPGSASVAPVSQSTGGQEAMPSSMHRTLLRVNKAAQKEQLSKHPQLRHYSWSSGRCDICEEWHCKSQGSFVIRHSCGVVHCGGCYEEHQGKCQDPRIQEEIQISRQAFFEKHPELRTQALISGTCAACSDDLNAHHQILFEHCCGLAICGGCYLDHLPYCTGDGGDLDDFVFGDDESSSDHGIAYGPDLREEEW
jgi:hypothetical protein